MTSALAASTAGRLAIMLALVVVMLGALRTYQRRCDPSPELVRKLFHLGGGFLSLALPWLFTDFLPITILGIACATIFAALRLVPPLARGPGQVLAAIHRNTVGEFCFVASFASLFWLARGDKLLYGVPILVLSLADSFAALVGREYGKRRIVVAGGAKTIEGSVSFFLAAFLSVHIPVLLFGGTGRAESLLIAVNIALMTMMAEVAAWWGLDNLMIPLFAFLLLKAFLAKPAPALVVDLAVLLGLSAFVRAWRNRTTLADDALFGAAIWGYVAWALSDWRWIIPPLLVFVSYTAVSRWPPGATDRRLHFPAVLALVAPGQLWLLLYWATGRGTFFDPFATVFAAGLSIIALVRDGGAIRSRRRSILISTVKGLVVLVPSLLAMAGTSWATLLRLAACGVAGLVAVCVFALLQPEPDPDDASRWVCQALATMLASPLSLIPLYAGV